MLLNQRRVQGIHRTTLLNLRVFFWKRKQSTVISTKFLVPFQFPSLNKPQEDLPSSAAEVYGYQKRMFWHLRVERPQCCCSFYILLTYILWQLTGVWGPKLNYTEHQNRTSGACMTELQSQSRYDFQFYWNINLLRPSPISTHTSMRRVPLATWFHTGFYYCSLNVSSGTANRQRQPKLAPGPVRNGGEEQILTLHPMELVLPLSSFYHLQKRVIVLWKAMPKCIIYGSKFQLYRQF